MRCARCNEWVYNGFQREYNGKFYHEYCEVKQRLTDRLREKQEKENEMPKVQTGTEG
jgi:thiaminase